MPTERTIPAPIDLPTRGPEMANPLAPEWRGDETFRRSMPARPASFDEAARTVEAVIATTAPVQRRDARGFFHEVLAMDTLDLSRAEGAPVVDNHRLGSARDVVGIVQSVRRTEDSIVAVLRFSWAEDVEPIVARVKDGTLSGVSVGYRVGGWTERTDAQGRRIKGPTIWTIAEVSLTPNPADPNARIRSHQEDPIMEPETIDTTTAPEAAEMTRRADIRALVRSAGLDAQVADDLIDQNATLEAAKAAVWDAMQARRRAQPVIRSISPANDDPATI